MNSLKAIQVLVTDQIQTDSLIDALFVILGCWWNSQKTFDTDFLWNLTKWMEASV